MIEMRDKRGSHVEVIIAFVIFVTFIFFLFSIIQPSIGSQNDKKNILDHIEVGVIDRISEDMTTITIKVGSSSQNCIELNNEISGLGISPRVAAKGSLGKSLNIYISSTDSDDLRIERESTSDNLIKIYYSDAFSPVSTSFSICQNIERGTGYSLGLTKTNNYIFESKMADLINEDYQTFKSNLKIPEGVNFGYGIILSNGTSIETPNPEISTNIYIREKSIQYVDMDGNILEGYIKIKIW
jgi:hypothetical protein